LRRHSTLHSAIYVSVTEKKHSMDIQAKSTIKNTVALSSKLKSPSSLYQKACTVRKCSRCHNCYRSCTSMYPCHASSILSPLKHRLFLSLTPEQSAMTLRKCLTHFSVRNNLIDIMSCLPLVPPLQHSTTLEVVSILSLLLIHSTQPWGLSSVDGHPRLETTAFGLSIQQIQEIECGHS
jgi:hypothetical protein